MTGGGSRLEVVEIIDLEKLNERNYTVVGIKMLEEEIGVSLQG
jgi:hypothetical protein